MFYLELPTHPSPHPDATNAKTRITNDTSHWPSSVKARLCLLSLVEKHKRRSHCNITWATTT